MHCQVMIIFCDTNWVSQIVIRPKKSLSTFFEHLHITIWLEHISQSVTTTYLLTCFRIFLFRWNGLLKLTWKIDIKKRFRHISVLGDQLHFKIGIDNLADLLLFKYFFQILSLQPRIYSFFLIHKNIFFLSCGQNNFGYKICSIGSFFSRKNLWEKKFWQ